MHSGGCRLRLRKFKISPTNCLSVCWTAKTCGGTEGNLPRWSSEFRGPRVGIFRMGATLAGIRQSALAEEASMTSRKAGTLWFVVVLASVAALPGHAQSFRVQCPSSTITHPAANNDVAPPYTGPTPLTAGLNGYLVPSSPQTANGAIKCQ